MATIANLYSARHAQPALHLFEGHLLVCFVIQIETAAAAGVVANNAFKDRGGPVLRTLDALQDRGGRDRLADDGRMLAASSCDIFTVQSAADWRQKRDFVSYLNLVAGPRTPD